MNPVMASSVHAAHTQRAVDDEYLFPVMQNGKWGYIDRTGKMVIQPQFEQAGGFTGELAVVSVGGKQGLHDLGDDTIGGSSAVIQHVDGSKFGYINRQGQFVIEPQFDRAFGFDDGGLAVVNVGGRFVPQQYVIGGRWGAINRSGDIVIPLEYNSMLMIKDGLAPFNKGGQQNEVGMVVEGLWGYIDRTGKTVISPRFQQAKRFSQGLAPVNVGGRFEPRYIAKHDREIQWFSGGMWGFIDQKGEFAIPPRYEAAEEFSEGLAVVKRDGKYGYVDLAGSLVIPCKFDQAGDFSQGLAYTRMVAPDGAAVASFINTSGTSVILLEADSYSTGFSEDRCSVLKQNNGVLYYSVLDNNGKVILPWGRALIGRFHNGMAQVTEDGKVGYIDRDGNYVWRPSE
jgi:hypothetical protein